MKNFKRMLYLKFARKMSKNGNDNVPVPSIISNNTKIVGDISSSGVLHIDGRVEGDILCEELIIGVKGIIIGSITANNLQIYGVLQGKAKVDSLFIAKTAKLIGDATHTSIAIEPGAYIDGHCTHSGDGKKVEDLVKFEAKETKEKK